ncbi:hypothetical protein [Fictibacillus phosphorivorans]|uniref:hypothetical protein n=1 Tax=Fictibacillus phosphorivorans TaxID=1221500 RepID=UPI00129352C5|nr:hypothetical protein [Fictibacillus phosphorivorans]MQR93711.1 hypothetical protein [Fictibacillus phosphorivorans]
MNEKYSLNEETLKFIIDFEKKLQSGKQFTNKELVEKFHQSTFYKDSFSSYYYNASNKAIWYAVKRSGNWELTKKGTYTKK